MQVLMPTKHLQGVLLHLSAAGGGAESGECGGGHRLHDMLGRRFLSPVVGWTWARRWRLVSMGKWQHKTQNGDYLCETGSNRACFAH